MSTTASRQYTFVDDKNSSVPITASRVDAEFDNIITKLNQKAIVSATAPSTPIGGMLWVDTTTKTLKEYRNAEWVIHGVVHVGTAAPTTSQEGDLWYDTTNHLLESYNGTAWAKTMSMPGNTMGAMLWFSAPDAFGTLSSVAAGSVLRSQGVGSCPAWGDVALASEVSGTLGTSNGGTGVTLFQRGTTGAVTAATAKAVAFASNFADTNYTILFVPLHSTAATATEGKIMAKTVNSFLCTTTTNNSEDGEYLAVGS